MSLTILPQISSSGFAPRYHSAKPKSYKASDITSQADSNEKAAGKQIDPDKKVSSEKIDLDSAEKKIRVRIDPESKEVIIEVVNNKTGEKVLQIPGEEYLKLSQRIADFNDKHLDQTA